MSDEPLRPMTGVSSEQGEEERRPTTGAPTTGQSNMSSLPTINERNDDGLFAFLPPAQTPGASPMSYMAQSPYTMNVPSTGQQSLAPLLPGGQTSAGSPASAVHSFDDRSIAQSALSPAASYALDNANRLQIDARLPPTEQVTYHDGTYGRDLHTSYGADPDGDTIEMNELDRERSEDDDDKDKDKSYFYPPSGAEHDADGYQFNADDEDSPYAEVRASVSNIDDPEMPALTFRSWFLALFFSGIFSCINLFFQFRYPAPLVTPIIVQIMSYPCGKLLALILPITSWETKPWMRRIGFADEFSFNPGPFNIKEHTVIVLAANTAMAPAYAVNYVVVTEKFMGLPKQVGFTVLLMLTTQLIGYGMAGISRRFLVWPAAMIWPTNLVFCTLLNTLHAEDEDEEGTDKKQMSRYKFFMWVMIAAFAWYWLPGFLFQALSAFSYICWAVPNNVVVNQLFGVYSGLGMGLFTFDWSQVAYIGSPLVIPWWAAVNIFAGFVICYWIVAPAMYYSNVWNSAYLPISTSSVFDRYGMSYDTSQVVTGTGTLNVTSYEAYSPLYLPVTYAVLYGLCFAMATSVLVHTVLYHGPALLKAIKRVELEAEDVHYKLMRNYPEVPDYWYWAVLLFSVVVALIAIEVYNVGLPAWALFLSVFIGFIYVLPGGLVYAMTGQQIVINIVVELIGGYSMPGKPVANMLFKIYAVNSNVLAMSSIQDLKIGHYMKIPPRVTFAVQIVGATIAGLLQIGMQEWLFASVPDLCDPHQASNLSCPVASVFFSSTIVWGLIGPRRQFGPGSMYNNLLYGFLVGGLLPIPFWLLKRKYPKSWVASVNIPVMLAGASFMPPATGINYSSWILVGFLFQYLMRRKNFAWWSKYNFVLSAGLDSGTIFCGIFMFLVLQLPKGGTIFLSWWGNNVYAETADYAGLPFLTPPEEGFGPTTW